MKSISSHSRGFFIWDLVDVWLESFLFRAMA
jgi:hypothetical protein